MNNKRNWFPETYQFAVTRNNNYLHSLWIAIYLCIFQMPVILWVTTVRPVGAALLRGVKLLFRFMVLIPLSGLAGNLTTHNKSRDDIVALAMARVREQNT